MTDVNLYTYVGNNPVNYVDIMGLNAKKSLPDTIWIYDRDPISGERIQTLHPLIRQNTRDFLDKVYTDLWINLRITQAMRTIEKQDELYEQGRTTDWKIVTRVKGWYSYHNYWLAIDLVKIDENKKISYDVDWKKVSEIGEEFWFERLWEKDKAHLQMTYSFSTKELKKKVDNWETDMDWFVTVK